MGIARAVWIDLCCLPQPQGLWQAAATRCEVRRVTRPDDVPGAIAAQRPHFACVEYDYPDRHRLRAVSLLRRELPSLPLLMLTEYHSEALAIWAFRSRVWDYRVKPVAAETFAQLIGALARAGRAPHGTLIDPMPPALVAPAGHLRRPLAAARRTALAAAWIGEHFAESVRIGQVARMCLLSESEFSRVFHREQGVSFRRFLLQYRIARAREYLADAGTSVSQVAYAVGFNDLSQFGRVFRRITGLPATQYRARLARRAAFQPDLAVGAPGAESFHSGADRF